MTDDAERLQKHIMEWVSGTSNWLGKVLIPGKRSIIIACFQDGTEVHGQAMNIHYVGDADTQSRYVGLTGFDEVEAIASGRGNTLVALRSNCAGMEDALDDLRHAIVDYSLHLTDGAIIPVYCGSPRYTHTDQRASSFVEGTDEKCPTDFAADFFGDEKGCLLAEPPLGTHYAKKLQEALAERGKRDVTVVARQRGKIKSRKMGGRRVLRVDSTYHPGTAERYMEHHRSRLMGDFYRILELKGMKIALEFDPDGIADFRLGTGFSDYNPLGPTYRQGDLFGGFTGVYGPNVAEDSAGKRDGPDGSSAGQPGQNLQH